MGDSDSSLPSVQLSRKSRSRSRSRSSHSESNELVKETAASKGANTRRLRSYRGAEKGTGSSRNKGGVVVPSFTDFLKDPATSTAPATSAGSDSDLPSAVNVRDPGKLDAEQLRALAGHATASVMMVAKRSGHLQGPFVKRLKDAVASIEEVVSVLADRTEDSEARRLRVENGCLRREIENLKAELKAHRKEFAEMRAASAKAVKQADPVVETGREMANSLQQTLEEFKASLFASLGEMVDAKLEGLEDRLLPPKNYRPPLAADKRPDAQRTERLTPRRGKAGGSSTTASAPSTHTRRVEEFPPLPQPGPSSLAVPAISAPTPASAVAPSTEESWNVVARKPKKAKTAPVPTAASKDAPAAQPARKEGPAVKFQAPKTAAVIITLRSGADAEGHSYQQVLQRAETMVDISDLGLETGLRFKVTATGARMLEIPGPDGDAKAVKLAERLEVALDGMAWVARPVKCGDIRLTELSDSATKESVRAAVARVGRIPEDQVRVLDIRPGPGGMGATIVECPVTVANQLASAGRLMVGWTSAKVTPLEQRPLRCFKCMGLGHTRPTCPSDSDRGDKCCYRCGNKEHRSWECTAEKVRCVVCSEAGLPSEHVMGGRSCNPPITRGKDVGVARRTVTSTAQGRSLTREGTEMSE